MNITYTISISFGDYNNSWRHAHWTSEGRFGKDTSNPEVFKNKEHAIEQAERAVEFVKEHDLYLGDREVYITECRVVDGESDFEDKIVWKSGKF